MTQLRITIDAEFMDGEPVIILHTNPDRFKSVLDFLAKGIDLKLFNTTDLDRQPEVEAKDESLEWFFTTIFNNKNYVERSDGKSLGNFWAIAQHLQQQFLKRLRRHQKITHLRKV